VGRLRGFTRGGERSYALSLEIANLTRHGRDLFGCGCAALVPYRSNPARFGQDLVEGVTQRRKAAPGAIHRAVRSGEAPRFTPRGRGATRLSLEIANLTQRGRTSLLRLRRVRRVSYSALDSRFNAMGARGNAADEAGHPSRAGAGGSSAEARDMDAEMPVDHVALHAGNP